MPEKEDEIEDDGGKSRKVPGKEGEIGDDGGRPRKGRDMLNAKDEVFVVFVWS